MEKSEIEKKYSGYGYHGGGRKPTGIKRVSICISGQPEKIEKLKQMAAREEKTVSAFVLEKTGANKMEKDFFELYSKKDLLALEVGHNSVADWNVIIYDRRGKEAGNWGDPVIHVQGSHRELVFAKAYAELAEYFSEHFD